MPIGDQVGRRDDDIPRRIHELEMFRNEITALAGSAKAIAAAVQTGLGNLASSGTTWAGPVASPSTVSATGTISGGSLTSSAGVTGVNGTFSAGLSSPGAYTTDVTALPGTRQTVWQNNSGVYGFAPSTIATKTNLTSVPFTAADVLAVQPYLFQYNSQIAIRDDPGNPNYNPTYVVPWDIGLMAEHLIAHNMRCFVVFEEDGTTPKTIDYAMFGAIASLVVLREMATKLGMPTA